MKKNFYTIKYKAFLLVVFMLLNQVVKAQFSGYYDPSTWTVTENPVGTGGSVNTASAPLSISIVSGNSGNAGDTYFSIIMPATGTVTFDWSYSTVDGAQYDYPRYVLDGVETIVPGYSTAGSSVQNGTASIPVTAGQVFAFSMHTVDGVAGSGTTIFSNFTAPAAAACSGAVVAGTAVSSLPSICAGQTANLTVTGATIGTGLTLQWEEAPTGTGTFTPIAGATGYNYSVTGITADMDYHLVITCTNGGASDISSIVTVALSPTSLCYCSPLNGTTLHTYSYNYLDNVSITGTTLNSSNPTVGAGGYLQLSPSIPSNTATLTQGVTYNMVNTMIGSGYTTEVWIDYDQSGTFDVSEFIPLSASTGAGNTSSGIFTIPYTALPGQTGMRVRANYFPFTAGQACYDPFFDGETEDYTITIDAALPCAGAPVGGTASAPAGVCASSPFTLSVTGVTTGLGIDVQWEESPVGAGTWTDVVGATNNYYNHPGITSSTDFRLRVTCTNGGGVDYSNIVSVNLNPFYNCYCSPLTGTTLHTYSYNYLDNVSIPGTTLNSSNPTVGPGGYLQLDPSIPSNTAVLTQGVTYNMVNTMTGSGYTTEVWIDYDQNGVFDASEFTPLSSSGGAGNTSTGIFTVPITATPGLTGLRVRTNYFPFAATEACYDPYFDGETEDYIITIDAALPCAGTPVAGTAAGPAGVCPSAPFTLSLTGNTTGLGIEVQWEESPAGTGTWTPISGATNNYYGISGITSATDYRAVVTCTNGGGVDNSNTVSVAINPFYTCYCSPLTGTTLHTYSYNYINNVSIPGTTLNSSNPTLGPGGYLQLDPAIPSNTATLTQGVSYTMNNTMTFSGYTSEVWIDYDQNGTFDASEFVGLSASSGVGNISTGMITVPITALTGQTGMRVRANYYPFGSGDACYDPYFDGETEDYVITIDAALPCAGTPVAGTASGPSNICPTVPFDLTVSGYTTGLGITLQWEESPAGAGTWSAISGATNLLYTNPGITVPMDYRLVITCANGGGTDISNVISTSINSFLTCYCSPLNGTVLHNFVNDYMSNATILGTTLNSSNTTDPSTGYTQVPPAPGNNTADLAQGVSYTFNGTGNSIAGSPIQAAMWIDYDQSGTFDATEMIPLTVVSPFSATFTVPATATLGQTGMRVRLRGGNFTTACETFGSGETEDYIITIIAGVACSGNPVAGVATGPGSVCAGVSFNLSASGFSTGVTGITFQWESSPAGANTWSAISGATNTMYTVTNQTAATDYRFVATCTGSGGTDISNVVAVGQNASNQCYCTPTYANGGGGDNIVNVTLGTMNNSSTGNNPPYYIDFTTLQPGTLPIPDIVQGANASVSLTFNSDPNQYDGVWVDFNQDGVFDATEFFTSGLNAGSNGTSVVTVAVPGTANLGQTRMRVRGGDDVAMLATQACGATNSTWGEAEDYLVNITNNPLAVNLKTISATNIGKQNRVDWTTGTEQKGDYFEVERSADAHNFTRIGEVNAKGEASSYSFWDQTPLTGVNYYRLKLMTASGSYSYSQVVNATVRESNTFTVEAYPNPLVDGQPLTVTAYGPQGANATVSVCDVTGKVLRVVELSGASVNINMSALAQGMYLIKYSDSKHTETIKVNKQ